eukprot:4417319-Amphidinium_carterae.1
MVALERLVHESQPSQTAAAQADLKEDSTAPKPFPQLHRNPNHTPPTKRVLFWEQEKVGAVEALVRSCNTHINNADVQ